MTSETPAPRWYLRKRWILFAVLVMVFVAVILIVRNLQSKQTHQAPGGPAGAGGRGGQNGPVAVAVATAISGDIRVRIPGLGTITPLASVTVRTQIAGQLQKIAFTEGQIVHQGDFVAQIDPRPYDAALAQARGNLRRDQALLADAKLDLTRYEGLIKEDAIAGQQLDTQHALVDQYIGTVESDQAQIRMAELNVQYTHIVSPVTGRVGLRLVDQGNYVTPGDTNGIVIINQLEPITAIFPIPEDNIVSIMPRIRAGETLSVEAYDRTSSSKLADGHLLTVDNQIDTTTGTVKLRAQFDNKDGKLFPNQFVNIQLLVTVLHDQITIPNSAVHQGAPNGTLTSFVYLVNPDSTVAVRPITTGIVDAEQVAVTKGLAVGDLVVTEGGDRLRDGATVMLPSATPVHAKPAPGPAAGKTDGSRRRSKPASTP
ncbi:MAG: MdtA/MuxA family multidrug efflux RND transporter periplasmic adaptor subunit [Steroidobacterales bacterium]